MTTRISPTDLVRGSRRGRPWPARATLVRSWTGRAATSRATDSGLPAVVTSGTHRTRVSEMRDAAAPGDRHAVTGVPASAAAVAPDNTERRDLARWLPEHTGSGG
jgi:hypothetical protein